MFNKSFDRNGLSEIVNAVKELDDGYLVVVRSNGHLDELRQAVFLRLDRQGDSIWSNAQFTDDTVVNLFGPAVADTEDGACILAGSIKNHRTGKYNGLLLKFSLEGEIIWKKVFRGPFVSFRQAPDGGYIMGGGDAGRFYLVKADRDGEQEWESWLGDGGWQSGYAVDCTPDGGYVIAGRTGVPPFFFDIGVAKCDAAGNQAWSRVYGGPHSDDSFHKLKTLQDGSILVFGGRGNGSSQYSINRDAYLMKLDQDGGIIWEQVYDEPFSTSHISNLIELGDGSLVVAAMRYLSAGGRPRAALNKYSSAGELIWSRTYLGGNPNQSSYLYTIMQASDGGFLAMGSTFIGQNTFQDGWLLKTDSEGYTCDSVGCAIAGVSSSLRPAGSLQAAARLWLSPNPGVIWLRVEYALAAGLQPAWLEVVGYDGRLALRQRLDAASAQGTAELDMGRFPSGLYVVRILGEGGGLLAAQQWVKQ